ncbi:DNA polymerase [Shouchella lonarensis]|uniref:DNA-directed DNA polymerase n=1 Tax=Shouchella lonarensis TaxID=1464122 RepID=A0A1G6HRF7_9BACI|nr:DNA polymerase [Shouchella lonarensis]SDB96812.1 DNA polymerase [Shouchella lonarensis]
MTTLSIDIETYSSVDLPKQGLYKYAEATDFEVLLFAYAFDNEDVRIIDFAQGEQLPEEVLKALTDESIIKTAFNAQFERICLQSYLGINLPIQQWRCTQVHALTLGLPIHLAGVASTLKMDAQKDRAGKALIAYFSIPCKPTKVNGGRTRNLPEHDSEKWDKFKAYCVQDVIVEREIRKKLAAFPVNEFENELYVLDQHINDRGVLIDADLMENAIELDERYKQGVLDELQVLTNLENPNSVSQLKKWINEQGTEVETLNKESVATLLKETSNNDVKRALRLRTLLAKTSISKYKAMARGQCKDGRLRGILQFYGANRTGRWAGRFVQVQNLPRGTMSGKNVGIARKILKAGELEGLQMVYDNVPDVLSSLIRTAFIPEKGRRLLVSDFSAIEARVIAWLADEEWRVDVFKTHGKIYEASASAMFNVPIEEVDKELRQKGKVAELALGYQGSVGALKTMGALKMGLKEEELQPLVDAWREANPAIKQFWYDVERAAIKAVQTKEIVNVQGLTFMWDKATLFIRLPSGRRLAYTRPRIEHDTTFNKSGLTYEGAGNSGKTVRLRTYGGKLVENIVQAVARDCLAEAMMRLKEHEIVMHVHDEVVIEAPESTSLEEVEEIMSRPIEWAKDLPLDADGFVTNYYKKD